MRAVPFVCLAIVALYVVVRARRAADRAAVVRRLAALSAIAWLGEDSVVRAYGFYAYSAHLGPLVDRVPILVALIWSVVIDSAWTLAERLVGAGDRRLSLVAGGIVLADASLIEPVAVRAGLWWWTEPGLFDVPPIGIVGWAVFTTACVWVLDRSFIRSRTPVALLIGVLLPPAVTHLGLVAGWWGLLRWISVPIPAWIAVAVAWVALTALALASFRRRLRKRVPRADMLVRVPGAVFFYALLAIFGRGDLPLVAYCSAFAWPYLSLVDFEPRRERG